MIKLCRSSLLLLVAFVVTGCSGIHNTIGPDKMQSDLRESVEAPVVVAEGESPFCKVPPMELPETPKLVTLPEPFSAKLFFLLDKTEFTAESRVESQEIYQKILDRSFGEVVITGHTDTSASSAYNEALSLRRAQKVRQQLIDFGVPADSVRISAEGEYRLLVSTPDDTVEVRNRRVEINAR
ncbi:OmpA family protein [Methylophaga thiooxydans]|uniref:OmpA family protein n=1 Tax=Methylophaga thiooxydans TaxID=392484 RepID=UPI0002DED846|nr:OmpA family protein [Methylophaga thiooxydans]